MIGAVIKRKRAEMGWSQTKLARVSDTDQSYVSKWERGERELSGQNLQKIADALGMTVDEIREEAAQIEPPKPEGPRLVEDRASFTDWFNALAQSGIDTELFIVIAAIGREASTPPWVASVSIDHLLERTPLTRELLERVWPQVLKSEWLERRGSGEWTFILKFPE